MISLLNPKTGIASLYPFAVFAAMPSPLPPDQSTRVRGLVFKGDIAGAIAVYMEATGATQAEAEAEVNKLASQYGMGSGSGLPQMFARRSPAPTAPAPAGEPAA